MTKSDRLEANPTSNKHRWTSRIAIAAGTAVLLYFLPLFRIVPLGQEPAVQQDTSGAAKFDPIAFVEAFWTERLLPSSSKTVDASILIVEIKQNRKTARERYGRSLGLSDTYFFCLSGTGRVVSVDKDSIGLSLGDSDSQTDVLLETGILFGNAVRDGSGLLDVNDFTNSQEFNAISTELNRRIEAEVLPKLKEAATVGKTIRFVGCAQITDEDTDVSPLRVVPFVAEAL